MEKNQKSRGENKDGGLNPGIVETLAKKVLPVSPKLPLK